MGNIRRGLWLETHQERQGYQGHIRKTLGQCQEGLGPGAPCLALTHPQEVIIHQKKPLEASCVV